MSTGGSITANISKGAGHMAIDAQLNYREEGRYVRRPAIRAALANSQNKYVDLLRSVFQVPEPIIRYVTRLLVPGRLPGAASVVER